jgi:(2Fe-2S) ferredoxin
MTEAIAPVFTAERPDAGAPDAVLYAISQYNLSGGALKRLTAGLAAATPMACEVIRLEGTGEPLSAALDRLVATGYRDILVQPLGLPFPEAMRSWLPGALGHWLASKDDDLRPHLRIGGELLETSELTGFLSQAALAAAAGAQPADAGDTSLGKPGWDTPMRFTNHLVVCTGPRCHYRDAPSLLVALRQEIAEAHLGDDCLTTRTGCMYPCNKGPMLAVYPRGEWYRLPDAPAVRKFVETVLVGGQTLDDHLIHSARHVPLPV